VFWRPMWMSRWKKFLNSFNVIWVVQSSAQKYFAFLPRQITGVLIAIPCLTKRGVSRSSRTLVRDAVDADALLTNSADADGEVVWS
jgi:hypothetical protein